LGQGRHNLGQVLSQLGQLLGKDRYGGSQFSQLRTVGGQSLHQFGDAGRYVIDQDIPALQEAIAGMPEPTVVLNFDRELSIQDLVDVMQIGAKLKIKMVLGTQKNT